MKALIAILGVIALVAILMATVASRAETEETPAADDSAVSLATATFAGGCFWCMEGPFDELDGVVSTTSGYTGGQEADPTYEEVSSGSTGHTEAVEIVYNSEKIGYAELLDVFWRNIDPTTANRQFCDGGSQYRSGIFFQDEEQRALAETSKREIEQSGVLKGKPIVTEITAATAFYPAEEYHQDYYKKNPIRYKLYRTGCGRDRTLEKIWGEAAGH